MYRVPKVVQGTVSAQVRAMSQVWPPLLPATHSQHAQVPMSRFDTKPVNYESLAKTLDVVQQKSGEQFTLAEKILYSHLDDPKGQVRAGFSFPCFLLLLHPILTCMC